MASGIDQLMEEGVGTEVLRNSGNCFPPGPLDMVSQDVARFPPFRRAAQATDEYLAKLDLLRRRSEARMQMGGALPEPSVSILRLQNASMPLADE